MSIGFIYFFIFSKIRVQYLHTATAVIIHLFSHSQTLCLWHKFAISPFCYRSYHPFILPLANFVPTAQICHISILLPQLSFTYSPTRKLCAYGTNLPYLHTATAVWRYYRPAQRLYDTQRFLHAAPNNYGIRLPHPRYIPFRHTKNILHALPPETNLA